MLEDYESGVRRKPSRHTVGRMRWILLASAVLNLYLFYKSWSNNTTIVTLEKITQKLNADLSTEQKQIEHYKKQTMMTEERRSNCEKRLSEIDDKAGECQLRHKDCSDTLETTSAKLMEMNQNINSVTEEKGNLEIELEKKSMELDSIKEEVTKLQNEIEQYERNRQSPVVKQQTQVAEKEGENQQTARENRIGEVQKDEILKREIQNINSINTPTQKTVEKQQEEKRVVDVENDETVSKIVRDNQNAAIEATSFIECDFSETSLDKGKCNYAMEPSGLHWQFGKPAFLKEDATQCLYIDDTASDLGQKRSLIFQEIQTDKCLQLKINATIVGGGQLSVRDNDKIYDVKIETTNPQIPVWGLENIDLTPAPSHAVEITGMISKYGGVGLTRVLLSEGECSPDIKSELEFDDKVDEHDKEMLEDIA